MAVTLITLVALNLVVSLYNVVRQHRLEQKVAILQVTVEDSTQKTLELKESTAHEGEELGGSLDRIETHLGRLMRRVSKALPRKKPKKREPGKLELIRGGGGTPHEETPPSS